MLVFVLRFLLCRHTVNHDEEKLGAGSSDVNASIVSHKLPK